MLVELDDEIRFRELEEPSYVLHLLALIHSLAWYEHVTMNHCVLTLNYEGPVDWFSDVGPKKGWRIRSMQASRRWCFWGRPTLVESFDIEPFSDFSAK